MWWYNRCLFEVGRCDGGIGSESSQVVSAFRWVSIGRRVEGMEERSSVVSWEEGSVSSRLISISWGENVLAELREVLLVEFLRWTCFRAQSEGFESVEMRAMELKGRNGGSASWALVFVEGLREGCDVLDSGVASGSLPETAEIWGSWDPGSKVNIRLQLMYTFKERSRKAVLVKSK